MLMLNFVLQQAEGVEYNDDDPVPSITVKVSDSAIVFDE